MCYFFSYLDHVFESEVRLRRAQLLHHHLQLLQAQLPAAALVVAGKENIVLFNNLSPSHNTLK